MNKHLARLLLFTLALLLPTLVHAQGTGPGTRYDNIAFNAKGQPIVNATITVCLDPPIPLTTAPCTNLANIFSDEGLTVHMANPTTTAGLGNFGFWAAPGNYYYTISGNGIVPSGPFPVSVPCVPGVTSCGGGGGGTPANPNFSVQFNNNGAFGGSNLSYFAAGNSATGGPLFESLDPTLGFELSGGNQFVNWNFQTMQYNDSTFMPIAKGYLRPGQLQVTQAGNGGIPMVWGTRFTDTSPTGNFLQLDTAGGNPPLLVQACKAADYSGTPSVCTFANPVAAHHAIVISTTTYGVTCGNLGITDSLSLGIPGQIAQQCSNFTSGLGTFPLALSTFCVETQGSSGTESITIGDIPIFNGTYIIAAEYSGIAETGSANCPVDGSSSGATGAGSGTITTGTPITTSNANDLVVASSWYVGGAQAAMNVVPPFNSRGYFQTCTNCNGTVAMDFDDAFFTTTGSYSASWLLGSTSTNWMANIVAFVSSAAGANPFYVNTLGQTLTQKVTVPPLTPLSCVSTDSNSALVTLGGGCAGSTSVGLTITNPGIFSVTNSPVSNGNLNININGNSGGVPYFSNTTTLSSSPAFAINTLIKGQGVGQPPANSTLVDDGINPTQMPDGASVMNNALWRLLPNANPGTVINEAVCFNGSALAIVCPISTTTGVKGFAGQGAGNAGQAQVCVIGTCHVIFDNTSVVNDIAIPSATTAGYLHDTGGATETAGTQNFKVSGVNAGTGTAGTVDLLMPDSVSSSTGFASPMTTLGDMIDGGAAGVATRLGGATTPPSVTQILTSTPSGGSAATAPVWKTAGIVNRTITTSGSVLATDRANGILCNSGSALGLTLAQPGTTGFANNFVFYAENIGAGACTITSTSSTINGAATLVLNQGDIATIESPDNTNYTARTFSPQLTAGTGITFTRAAHGTTITSSAAASPLLTTTIAITSAQIKSLHTSGVQLIAAPGAGKYILVNSVSCEYIFVTPAYTTASGILTVEWGAGGVPPTGNIASQFQQSQAGFIDQTSSQISLAPGQNTLYPISTVSNVPISLYSETGSDATLGNGTLSITITYSVVTL